MKNFINLKDIPTKDLRKILNDAKKRKNKRKKLNTLDVDKDQPLKGKLLIQMYEKQSSRTRLSFHLAINQLGAGSITLPDGNFLSFLIILAVVTNVALSISFAAFVSG